MKRKRRKKRQQRRARSYKPGMFGAREVPRDIEDRGHSPGQYRELISDLQHQGWRVELTKQGHYKAFPPDPNAEMVLFSTNPGAKKKVLSQLRRSGYQLHEQPLLQLPAQVQQRRDWRKGVVEDAFRTSNIAELSSQYEYAKGNELQAWNKTLAYYDVRLLTALREMAENWRDVRPNFAEKLDELIELQRDVQEPASRGAREASERGGYQDNPRGARCGVDAYGIYKHRGGCCPGRPACRRQRRDEGLCHCAAYHYPHRSGSGRCGSPEQMDLYVYGPRRAGEVEGEVAPVEAAPVVAPVAAPAKAPAAAPAAVAASAKAAPTAPAAGTSTSTSSVAPTSTKTRTSTSTRAHTQGNVTVTGGAGKGATTTVRIHSAREQSEPSAEVADAVPWVKLERDPQQYAEQIAGAQQAGPITSARAVYDLLAPSLAKEDQEVFIVVAVDIRGQCRGVTEVHRGARSRVSVDVPEILRVANALGGEMFVVVHNHPTTRANPSAADRSLTKAIEKAARASEQVMMDHVVIGMGEYFSFAENKLTKVASGARRETKAEPTRSTPPTADESPVANEASVSLPFPPIDEVRPGTWRAVIIAPPHVPEWLLTKGGLEITYPDPSDEPWQKIWWNGETPTHEAECEHPGCRSWSEWTPEEWIAISHDSALAFVDILAGHVPPRRGSDLIQWHDPLEEFRVELFKKAHAGTGGRPDLRWRYDAFETLTPTKNGSPIFWFDHGAPVRPATVLDFQHFKQGSTLKKKPGRPLYAMTWADFENGDWPKEVEKLGAWEAAERAREERPADWDRQYVIAPHNTPEWLIPKRPAYLWSKAYPAIEVDVPEEYDEWAAVLKQFGLDPVTGPHGVSWADVRRDLFSSTPADYALPKLYRVVKRGPQARDIPIGEMAAAEGLKAVGVRHNGSAVWWTDLDHGPVVPASLYDLARFDQPHTIPLKDFRADVALMTQGETDKDLIKQTRKRVMQAAKRPLWLLSLQQWDDQEFPAPSQGGPPFIEHVSVGHEA